MGDVVLRPADIVLTRGSRWISKAIRFFTRRIGESRTMVNHAAIVVDGGPLDKAVIVEALATVKRHPLWRYANTANAVCIFRPLNLDGEERGAIIREAESYVGRKYGPMKLVLHLGDWVLQGAYFFRRLGAMDRYPICSWLVAHAYAVVGKDFGVKPGAASPDDIWDFCVENPDKYAIVYPLSPLKKG